MGDTLKEKSKIGDHVLYQYNSPTLFLGTPSDTKSIDTIDKEFSNRQNPGDMVFYSLFGSHVQPTHTINQTFCNIFICSSFRCSN